MINAPLYGRVDKSLAGAAEQDVLANATVASPRGRQRQITARVTAHYTRGEQALLVKGKWLPAYLEHRVRGIVPPGAPLHFAGIATISACLLNYSYRELRSGHCR